MAVVREMSREEIIAALAAIERALAETVTITHHIISPDGTEVGRISKTVRFPRPDLQQKEKSS